VRVYKTRSMAKDACDSGRVRVNDAVAKPATKISAGDVVEARRRDRTVIYAVVDPIEKRVSATLARQCVEDRSPPPPPRPGSDAQGAPAAGLRERGAGRPTKRERREIDRMRGR
jgi:ribosome-associated heat shock protein Hsp15